MALDKQGPEEITGRFDTREQLVRRVVNLRTGRSSLEGTAEDCQVSITTVVNIMKEAGGEQQRDKDLKKLVLRNLWDANLTPLI